MSDNTLYLLILAIMALIALLTFSKVKEEIILNKGYLSATKSFQIRCENDGFMVLNETLYHCSKAVEVPSVDLELGE